MGVGGLLRGKGFLHTFLLYQKSRQIGEKGVVRGIGL